MRVCHRSSRTASIDLSSCPWPHLPTSSFSPAPLVKGSLPSPRPTTRHAQACVSRAVSSHWPALKCVHAGKRHLSPLSSPRVGTSHPLLLAVTLGNMDEAALQTTHVHVMGTGEVNNEGQGDCLLSFLSLTSISYSRLPSTADGVLFPVLAFTSIPENSLIQKKYNKQYAFVLQTT